MKTVHTMIIGIALSALSAASMALPAKEIGSWANHTCKEVMAPLVAEGGADRLNDRRVAEGGGDRLNDRRVAEGGAERLNARRVAKVDADRATYA
ncbi:MULTISPECIES: hypothetical protein [Pseudomonas]|uniref:hypothetical protein n=1 Tax=Pseudomonas TaxID=286 RepID=UPI0014170502|nr:MULTISPECIES: hypothetical protein [Pseudomonas]